ncbi:MAG TPA: hypothetical protein VF576_00780 [Rubricoccaceae bacterium]|jgi:hypothetical protein
MPPPYTPSPPRRRLAGPDPLGLLGTALPGTFDLDAPPALRDFGRLFSDVAPPTEVVPPLVVAPGAPAVLPDAPTTVLPEAVVPDNRPQIVAPNFADDVARIADLRPEARNTNAARIAAVVASLGGAAATLAGGSDPSPVWGGLSAVLGGVAQGTGRYAREIETSDAQRMLAHQEALTKAVTARINGEASVYGTQVDAETAAAGQLATTRRADAQNQTTLAVADKVLGGQNYRAELVEASDQYQQAVSSGSPDAAARIAEAEGFDVEAARAAAQAVADVIAEKERIAGGTLDVNQRRAAVAEAGLRLGWYNAATSRISATRPAAARSGGGGGGGRSGPTPTQTFDAYRNLLSLRGRIGEDGFTQADYDAAEALYADGFGALPGAPSNPAGAGAGPLRPAGAGALLTPGGLDLNDPFTLTRLRASGATEEDIEEARREARGD